MNMRRKLSFPGLGSLLSYFPGRVTYSRMGVGTERSPWSLVRGPVDRKGSRDLAVHGT